MKTTPLRLGWITCLACLAAPVAFAATSKADLLPSDKRATAIATGNRLARPGELPTVAADMVSPFNPPDFDQPMPETASARAGGSAAASTAATPAQGQGARMSSARDIVESMAPLIPARGTIQKGEDYLLTIEGKNYKVGDSINITVGEGPKYPLEITRITKTDFTVRYQGEVKTRPIVIKPSSK